MLRQYIDLQVNGYMGVDFSSPLLTAAQIASVADKLAVRGTAAFCPTVITSYDKTYEHVLPLLGAAVHSSQLAGRLAGVHLEGPFINPAPGAVGAHNADFTKLPSVKKFEHLWQLSDQTIKLLTIAPELPGADELICAAVEKGVAVSLGHTLCGSKEVQMAVDNGATLCTHLGNGCPNLIDRHANPIWAQLDSPLKIMLITDGHHLPLTMLRIFLQLRSADEIILTSDSASVAGLPPGTYELASSKVKVTSSGRIENANAPNLAGSNATLAECVEFLKSHKLASQDQIRKFTYHNPLTAINMNIQNLPSNQLQHATTRT